MGPRAISGGSCAPLTPKYPWRLEMKGCGARMWLQVLGEVTLAAPALPSLEKAKMEWDVSKAEGKHNGAAHTDASSSRMWSSGLV